MRDVLEWKKLRKETWIIAIFFVEEAMNKKLAELAEKWWSKKQKWFESICKIIGTGYIKIYKWCVSNTWSKNNENEAGIAYFLKKVT